MIPTDWWMIGGLVLAICAVLWLRLTRTRRDRDLYVSETWLQESRGKGRR